MFTSEQGSHVRMWLTVCSSFSWKCSSIVVSSWNYCWGATTCLLTIQTVITVEVTLVLCHFFLCQVDVFYTQHMACVLLTDMNLSSSSPPAPSTSQVPEQDVKPTFLTVHLHQPGKVQQGGSFSQNILIFPSGDYVAEELCINAAKACGELHGNFTSPICPQTQNVTLFIHLSTDRDFQQALRFFFF